MSRYHDHTWERDRLLALYPQARGEERIKILARLVVLDEEGEEDAHTERSNGRSTNPDECEIMRKFFKDLINGKK